MMLADAALERMGKHRPTPGILRSSRLLADFAWSGRTAATRNSQWRAWVEFCTTENRPLLPATEAHLIAFVGWLASEREAGKRSVRSTSLPQYFSAVKQMQATLTRIPGPHFPFLPHVTRAYARWGDANYPLPKVRCGVPASAIQAIWGVGMSANSPGQLRDVAMVVFAYCLNGLRESSVTFLVADGVRATDAELVAKLSIVKGQMASQVPLVRYARLSAAHPSPLDLWLRWLHARGRHPCSFALPGERNPLPPGAMTSALERCLMSVGVEALASGKYTSHSLRIGAHTEQVLLGFPLEVRLSRFGWGSRSAEMASTYFDRTIQLSPASFWVFGPPCGRQSVAPATV